MSELLGGHMNGRDKSLPPLEITDDDIIVSEMVEGKGKDLPNISNTQNTSSEPKKPGKFPKGTGSFDVRSNNAADLSYSELRVRAQLSAIEAEKAVKKPADDLRRAEELRKKIDLKKSLNKARKEIEKADRPGITAYPELKRQQLNVLLAAKKLVTAKEKKRMEQEYDAKIAVKKAELSRQKAEKEAERKKRATVESSGVVENKSKIKKDQELPSIIVEQGLVEQELPKVILDRGFEVEMSKTAAQLREDEIRLQNAKPKFYEDVEGVPDIDTSRDIAAQIHKNIMESEAEPLFTVENFLRSNLSSEQNNLRGSGRGLVGKKGENTHRLELDNAAESAKLSYVLAYKDLYPDVKDVDEDIVAAYQPPSKWFAFSKAKKNLIELYKQMVLARDAAKEDSEKQKLEIDKNLKDFVDSKKEIKDDEETDKSVKNKTHKTLLTSKGAFSSAKQLAINKEVDAFLDAQPEGKRQEPELKLKTLKDIKAQEYLDKKMYAAEYREQFPQHAKESDEFISLLPPPKKPGIFTGSKKRELYRLYVNMQDSMSSLENAQNKKSK